MHFIEIVCHLRKTNVLLFFDEGLVGKARHFWKTGLFCNRIIIYAIDSPVVFWHTFYHLSEQIELVLMTQKYCTYGLARCAVTLCDFFPVSSCNKSLVISCKLKLSVASKPSAPTICPNNQVQNLLVKFSLGSDGGIPDSEMLLFYPDTAREKLLAKLISLLSSSSWNTKFEIFAGMRKIRLKYLTINLPGASLLT